MQIWELMQRMAPQDPVQHMTHSTQHHQVDRHSPAAEAGAGFCPTTPADVAHAQGKSDAWHGGTPDRVSTLCAAQQHAARGGAPDSAGVATGCLLYTSPSPRD